MTLEVIPFSTYITTLCEYDIFGVFTANEVIDMIQIHTQHKSVYNIQVEMRSVPAQVLAKDMKDLSNDNLLVKSIWHTCVQKV